MLSYLAKIAPFSMLLLAGCGAIPVGLESRFPPQATRGIVFVVDGAGGYQTVDRAVIRLVDEAGLPLHIRSFDWTHGRGRFVADELDRGNIDRESQRLAAEIAEYHHLNPTVPIYLIAYSAGGVLALHATEMLPPDHIERIVLLAPAVSAGYDLRRALCLSHRGIDAFTSTRDLFYLYYGTGLLGTSDGRRDVAAGRLGFRVPAQGSADVAVYAKLRQYPWHPSLKWTGNEGQHTGSFQPIYFRAFVQPLLTPGA